VDITVHFAARAIDTVRRVAAAEILPRYRNVVAMEKDDGSTVTEADFASQAALCRGLTALEPVPIIAEEMRAEEQLAAWRTSGRLWCIDPLDGTRNFASAVPFFAVSVALMEEGRSVMGIVYDPIADEAFYAVRGAGAWLNHRPLVVPALSPPLARAVAEVSLRRNTARLRGELKHRRPYARRVTSGSSALSWCHLAAARIDVMLHSGQKMWDYAAGALVLEEARGVASTLERDDFWECDPWSRSVVAARSPALLREWRGWLRERLDPAQPTTERT
jgi:myo-inositol-1(or 4)-monophosphatase